MKTKLKIIVLAIAMFVAGIATACAIGRFIVMPDLAKDISKMAYEGAINGYQAGYSDAANKSADMYDTYFNEETMKEINNWEYKYIK